MELAQLHNYLASLVDAELRPGLYGASTEVVAAVHDSRQVVPGSLFCAVPGDNFDGHSFVGDAASKGATAALVERWVDNVALAQVKVPRVRPAMPHAAAALAGHPSRDLAVFGITGTNGKTTTTHLFASIMGHAGRSCAVIGTLGGVHTTPESTELQRMLRELAAEGTEVVALEVSSHALDQHRVGAVEFDVAAFSNLTPDHLDYHVTMEAYFAAKAKLFSERARVELINVDDQWGAKLASTRPEAHHLSLGSVQVTSRTVAGSTFVWRDQTMHVPLPGEMNIANALMAIEAAAAMGVPHEQIATGLAGAEQVPGRMELVKADVASAPAPTVIVDYCHTPDSISRALQTIRSTAPRAAVSIVFGCGGDRDRTKRPLMGAAAEAGADAVYLTSDNPRSEDPLLIIADALAGIGQAHDVIVEPDRRDAIARAIIDAGPHDVVLIAGKGHEKTQTIGDDVLPFDDVTVARELLEDLNR